MQFKDFLILESGFSDHGSDWFYGSVLLPSDAFDWVYAHPEPADFKFLQSRWKRERKAGRKFHNLDVDKTLKTRFTSVYSQTMPGHDSWKHKPDKRPNVVVDDDAPMKLHGIRSTADVANVLYKSNDLIDKTKELDRLFGVFKPKELDLPKDFDKPWRHK